LFGNNLDIGCIFLVWHRKTPFKMEKISSAIALGIVIRCIRQRSLPILK
jgi:hypothetical protein